MDLTNPEDLNRESSPPFVPIVLVMYTRVAEKIRQDFPKSSVHFLNILVAWMWRNVPGRSIFHPRGVYMLYPPPLGDVTNEINYLGRALHTVTHVR